MKEVIEYISTKGMYPVERSDYQYLVAWIDGERVKLGFSEFKDLMEGCAIVSYEHNSFMKDPYGIMSRFLDAHRDCVNEVRQSLIKIHNNRQNGEI